jgi:uncharacterized protein (DUF2141 family)
MIALISVLSFAFVSVARAEGPVLEIKALRSGEGSVAVSVFSAENTKGFPGQAESAAKTFYVSLDGKSSVEIPLQGLEPGRYAIAVMHDADGDRKLKSVLGIPREGFGFSNNPRIYFGPPSFDKATVSIDGASRISIEMKYML